MKDDSAPRVLVVDDDRAVRDAVSNLLTDEGFGVVTAEDGQDALERLAEMEGEGAPPCLILLDLRMPRIDGWEFLARRDGSAAARAPVVLLSGMSFIRDAPGVADFLSKPIRPERLLDCVRRFCRAGAEPRGAGE